LRFCAESSVEKQSNAKTSAVSFRMKVLSLMPSGGISSTDELINITRKRFVA